MIAFPEESTAAASGAISPLGPEIVTGLVQSACSGGSGNSMDLGSRAGSRPNRERRANRREREIYGAETRVAARQNHPSQPRRAGAGTLPGGVQAKGTEHATIFFASCIVGFLGHNRRAIIADSYMVGGNMHATRECR